MTTDPFTVAARTEAENFARTPRMNVGTIRDRIAEAHWTGAEWARAHLSAHAPQVTIVQEYGQPATCEVRQGGVLIFTGRDRSADLRVTAQEPTDTEIEAAALAIFEIRDDAYDLDEWEDLTAVDRERYVCDARAALRSAHAARRDEDR